MLLGAARMEEKQGVLAGRERDQFPVGMRVLAVDDDPVCLKLLETLLRRCQYHGQTLLRFVTVSRYAVSCTFTYSCGFLDIKIAEFVP